MRRKIIMAMLMASILAFTGCGGATGQGADSNAAGNSNSGDSSSSFGSTFEIMEFDKTATIPETVLYDENNLKITAKGLKFDDYGVNLMVTLENNSDKKYRFNAETMSCAYNTVNDYMIEDGYCSKEVEPGTSEDVKINFSISELMMHGIFSVAEIGVGFEMSDDDYNILSTGPITIPTSIASSFDPNNKNYKKAITGKMLQNTYDFKVPYFGEEQVYSENGVTIVSEAFVENKDGEHAVMLEIKNDTNVILDLRIRNTTVNGNSVYDGLWSADMLLPGKKMLQEIRIENVLKDEWASLGITEIEKIGFEIEAKTTDGMVVAGPATVEVKVK